MNLFRCTHCQQRVFFDNVACITCGSMLGFVPAELQMVSFSVDGQYTRLGEGGPSQRPCANYAAQAVCNWMVGADDPNPLCVCCRTTAIIPALSTPENQAYWAGLEAAKRRLFHTLIGLKLPVPNRETDPVNGLSFQFLEDTPQGPRVLTGHDEGVITLNIAEADDAKREAMRAAMHEPYRTLLGHFRHEIGHYYWDRLVRDTAWIDECRALFGDEREDYAAALQRHYHQPRADWAQDFISLYASSHPWEDWAECWAHYLHMLDGLETAKGWGVRIDNAVEGGPPLQIVGLGAGAQSIEEALIEQWLPLAQFSNAMNRSLGLHDSYPFVVTTAVVKKLAFVHRVVDAAMRGDVPMNFASPQAIEPALSPQTEPEAGGMAALAEAAA